MCATLPDIFNIQGIKTKIIFFDSDDDNVIKSVDNKLEPPQDLDEKVGNDDPDIEVKTSTEDYELIGEYLSDTLYANINKPSDLYSSADTSLIENHLICDSKTNSKPKNCNDKKSKFKTPSEKKSSSKNRNNKKNKSKKYHKDIAFISKKCNFKSKSLIHNRTTIIPANERNEIARPIKDYIFKKWAESQQKKIEPCKKLLKNTKFSKNQKNKTVKLVPLYKEISPPTLQLNSTKSIIPCSMPIIPDDENNNVHKNEIQIKNYIDQDNVGDQIPCKKIEVKVNTKPSMKIKSFSFEKGPQCQKIRISYPISKPSHESVENKTLKHFETILNYLNDKNKVETNNCEEINYDVNICFANSEPQNNLLTENGSLRASSNDVTKTNYNWALHQDSYVSHFFNPINISTNNVQYMQQKIDPNNLQGTVLPSVLYRNTTVNDINSNSVRTVPRRKNQKYKTLRKHKMNTIKFKKGPKSTEPDQANNKQTTSLELRMFRMISGSIQNGNCPQSNQLNNIDTNRLLPGNPRSVPNLYSLLLNQQTMRIPEPNVNHLYPGTNQMNYIQPNRTPMAYPPPYNQLYPKNRAMMKNIKESLAKGIAEASHANIRPTSLNLPQNNLWGNTNILRNHLQYSYPTEISPLSITNYKAPFPRRSMSRDSGCFSPPTDCMDSAAMKFQTPTFEGNDDSSKNMSIVPEIVPDTECIVCNTRTNSSCLKCRGSYYCSAKCQADAMLLTPDLTTFKQLLQMSQLGNLRHESI